MTCLQSLFRLSWFKWLILGPIVMGLVLMTITPVPAIPIEQVTNLKQSQGLWVTDAANLLAADTETQLNHTLGQLHSDTDVEMAVVTVPDVAPLPSVESYAKQLFATWEIGDRTRNNGVLLLIAKNNRRTEIVAGPGLNHAFTHDRIRSLLKNHASPAFAQGQFDQGTVALVLAMVDTIRQPPKGNNVWVDWGLAFWGLLIMLLSLGLLSRGAFRRKPLYRSRTASRSSSGTLESSSDEGFGDDSSDGGDGGSTLESSSDEGFGGGSSDGGASGGDSW